MLKDEMGFTLLESLIVISLLVIIISLFPLMTKLIGSSKNFDTHGQFELMIFMNQLNDDLLESVEMHVLDKELILIKGDGREISYRHVENMQVRRFAKNTGYVPMLFRVEYFQCVKDLPRLRCDVKLIDGQETSRVMMPMYGVSQGVRDEE
jgi:competence protein ComGF